MIPTPSGHCSMIDLKVGDQVFDEHGKVCEVLACSDVELRDTYRVVFSDGNEICADGDHLWTTLDTLARCAISRDHGFIPEQWHSWRGRGRPKPRESLSKISCRVDGCEHAAKSNLRGYCNGHYQQVAAGREIKLLQYPCPSASTKTTTEIMSSLYFGPRMDSNHAIPACLPLELPDADLPIDPYVLGAWLGDGNSKDARITSADGEVVESFRAAGYSTTAKQKKGKATTYAVYDGLYRSLRLAGVLKNKHIPKAYLRSSYQQRIALLQGLMDTDGWISGKNSCCEFTTTNPAIAEGIYELLVSLGVVVTMVESRAKLYGRDCGQRWRVRFTPAGIPAFRIRRKSDRLSLAKPKRQSGRKLRFIREVIPAGKAFVRCITVSSQSGLFLAGRGMIPTHNSRTVATRVLARCLTEPRYSVLVFSPTEDQSKEFLSYVAQMNDDLGCPVPLIRQSLSELAWSNGSRVKAKADSPRGSRGFTPNMIVVDEGAQVSDELYLSIKPMMVLGQSEMMVLSTPFGKHGWFFDIWDDPKKLQKWETFKVTAYDCPRIDPAVLEEHRLTMPARWFNQEYLVEFNDAVDAVFGKSVIDAAERDDARFEPLYLN
jgi:hypothetical protein